MKLFVGLGNPGEKYQNNRHNVGWHFLDYLIQKMKFSRNKSQETNNFQFDKYTNSEIISIYANDEMLILAKPQTFMNESGVAVRRLTDHYRLTTNNDLVIIHDDLDMKLGEYKIQKGKGPQLHNGIESIENHLKTKDFWRVRIGVDNRVPENRIPGEKYVLQDFSPEERVILKTVFHEIINELSQMPQV